MALTHLADQRRDRVCIGGVTHVKDDCVLLSHKLSHPLLEIPVEVHRPFGCDRCEFLFRDTLLIHLFMPIYIPIFLSFTMFTV